MSQPRRLLLVCPQAYIDPRVKLYWLRLQPAHPAAIDAYVKIMETAQQPPAGFGEQHHLLTRRKFPRFSNLKRHPWNRRYLSHEDHTTAHALLVAAFPGDVVLFASLCAQRGIKIGSRQPQRTIDRILRLLKPQDGAATVSRRRVAAKVGVARATVALVALTNGIGPVRRKRVEKIIQWLSVAR